MKNYSLMKGTKYLLALIFCFTCSLSMQAQRVAVSSNIIDLAMLTPNVELELNINYKHSFALGVEVNPWRVNDNLSFEHLSVRGEYRFWLDQVMYAHYVGIVAQLSSNNYKFAGSDFMGDMCALGVGYGYSFLVSRKINIVPNISCGCGYNLSPGDGGAKFKPMLLNFGVTFQYLIK